MKADLTIYSKPIEGDLNHTYSALQNLQLADKTIGGFTVTNKLNLSLNHPINIECQPSYDGTVNLILNDDLNPPRIINTRFSKIENNRYKIINRNQTVQSNIYTPDNVDLETRLFRTTSTFPTIEFTYLQHGGQLKGGNYVFYIKFADSDENETDIVCESGIVSIFHGVPAEPDSVSGTLLNEETDKAVKLQLSGIDTTFPKFYVYYSRETSDLNGIRVAEIGKFTEPYDVSGSTQDLIIYGYEETQLLTEDDLNIAYFTVSAAKTQAQVQNMLFLGNIQESDNNYKLLQNLSYWIKVTLKQKSESIGWVAPVNYQANGNGSEYYDPKNIYYNLGYWPDEMYRLGVVYIMADDTLSPVFNLRGCSFENIGSSNISDDELFEDHGDELIPTNSFLSSENYDNSYGVFKNPKETSQNSIYNYTNGGSVKPWYYHITFADDRIKELLKDLDVKGFFIVRQKRIPTTLCQGVSIGVDKSANIPTPYKDGKYIAESFINNNKRLASSWLKIGQDSINGSGLLSLEATVLPEVQSKINGSTLVLEKVLTNGVLAHAGGNSPHYIYSFYESGSLDNYKLPCTFVKENTPYKYTGGYGFSTRVGSEYDLKEYGFFGVDNKTHADVQTSVVRGIYTSFIGVCGQITPSCMYNVKIPNYHAEALKDYIIVRGNDNAPFYAISNRYSLSNFRSTDVYRGDCFTTTVTMRLNRNFTDPDVPINDTIVDAETWSEVEYGKMDAEKWKNVNRADVNTVPLGIWISYKCLSSYNLGLRSDDSSDLEELALLGTPKSFFPKQGIELKSALKLSESTILNRGLGSTTSRRWNGGVQHVPYIKNMFDNRVMFSNVFTEENFRNGYRIFQGLSYKDIDRQYGAIVKLIPWGTNLFCVFEHGLGIIPINEKALIQTATDQSVHMYGAGVIQNQISLISQDFGSIWQDSVIRTPIGLYGVDTYAKKIWRFTDSKGLEILSDMKIQRFLNEHLKLSEHDKYPTVALKNVKTHYNNYKGDVMFTFYNDSQDETWNFCFNERIGKWITRYSWTPLYSANIDNIFYSIDQNRAKVLAHIYNNRNCTYGLRCSVNEISNNMGVTEFPLSFVGTEISQDSIQYLLKNITITYIDDNNSEQKIVIDNPSGVTIIDNILKIDYPVFVEDLFKNFKFRTPLHIFIKINCKLNNYISYQDTIGIINKLNTNWETYSKNGFYIHGRAGIFDELNYNDSDFTNQILPTKWYDKQEPFEFEFVVNGDTGFHKIFNNLVIISNNVQPKEFEFSIIGDAYNFNKIGIFRQEEFGKSEWETAPTRIYDNKSYQVSQVLENCKVSWDNNQNNYWLTVTQNTKNIKDFGRLLGNIHYKEDSWYITLDPIKFKNKYLIDGSEAIGSESQFTRLRDKFIKIKVKYSGEDLVIITALNTLLTISHS